MVPVTAKNVTIKVHSHVEQIKELTLATHDGQPDVIKADKNVNYEFFDHSIGRAPNHIIAKRKGKDLHVSFEREGQNDDLIIEGFFEDEDKALIGVAEDGHYYYYIPDTGEVADYVTQLQDADVEGQALGGEHHLTPLWLMLPTGTFPWWPLLGLGVIPFLGKDDDDKPAPAPDSVISTTNDSERGDADNPVRVNVLKNDADNAVPETLRLIDPKTGRPTTEKVVVSGQGTWELDSKEPGVVIFTPEKGYNGNPTPINYVVKNKESKESQPTPVFIIYDAQTTPDTKPGTPGQPVTQNVTSNDGDVDPSTVKLVDSNNPPSNEVKVPGKGTWTVGPKPGEVTFTPEDGFTGDPDPIKYVVKDKGGNDLPPTDVDVSYPQLTNPDTKPGTPGQPVTQNVTSNDGDVDPSTVKLVDPNNPNNPPSNEVKVPGKGTWTVGPKPGEVTFTPEDGFTGDPDPIKYVVKDKDGKDLPPTSVDVTYPEPTQPTPTNPDTKPGTPGQPVTQNVTSNDGDVNPSTVKLVDPNNPNNPPSNEVKVPGQGTWTVGPKPGEVTFTPEDGFTGDPDPIKYVVKDKGGNDLPPTDVDVSYPQLTNPDTKPGAPGQPVTQNVTNNDGDVDPSTVKLVDPKTGEPTDKIVVPNEGTWTVGPKPGEVTFTPEDGFTGNPGPVNYYINDKSGNQLQPTPVAVTYPSKPADNDKPAVSLTGLTNVNEGVGKVQYTVHLENVDNTKDTVVTVSLTNGKAVIGEDYKGDTYTVTIPKGKTTATFEVPIVNDDPAVYEGPEDYNVTITAINGQAVKTPADNQRVTTTIHDDGKGTPDGRDPNNPDNQDPNKPQDPTKPFDPSKPVDANNPDPRTPPKDKLPDADNDKPAVSLTGLTNVNEGVGKVQYTVHLENVDNTKDTVVTVSLTNGKAVIGEDYKGDTYTVTIPKGKTTATFEVPIVNDDPAVYEGPEDYNVTITAINGQAVKTPADNQRVTTTIHDDGKGTPDGRDPNNPDNQDPNKPQDPTKPFDPSKPVDANNPDPRTPPKDKLPDADNDKPAVSLTGLTNVNEGVGKVQYTVHLENVDNTKDTVVTVSLTNGKAVIGEDYKGDTYTVTIPKGKTTATFEVPIVNDDPAVYEGPEDYNVTITAINGQAVKTPADNQRVTTTIHDDGKGTPDGRDPNNPDNQDPNKPQDPTKPFDPSKPVDANNPDPRTPPKDKLPDADNDKPAVSLTGLTNVNEGVGKVQYTVHLENVDNTKDTVVTVSLTNGKAVIGEDYKGDTYTVTIPKGKTTATFEVPIVNDDPAVYEGPEDYNVTITAINGQAVKTPADNQRVTTTIHDDGKGTPDGRDPNNPDNQDPNKPQDPTKPFDPSKPVDANNPDPRTPPKDKLPDADNDKPAVSLTGLTNVNEGVGKVQYTVHLENVDNTKDTVVTVSLTNGKAVIGEDYKGDTYTVTIPKGKTTATFEVPIVNDDPAVYEGPEDYNVTITAINGQAVKTPADNQRVTTTIHDDGKGTPDGRDPNNPDNQDPNKPQDPTKPFDPSKPVDANNPDPRTPPKDKLPDADNDKPAVSLTGLTNVNEGVGKVQYTVHLENVDNTKDTVVTVSLTNGKAVIGEDYKGDTYTVTIPKGKTTATFEVPIVNDDPAVYEGPEDYNVTITAINGQAVKTPADNQRVTTTIHDDGKGTPDGRDPNNPDNQDPNKPQDPTKPFDPSKPVDANNPDPRTPPKDKLPDADNDKPAVSLTGLTNVNEGVGKVQYTVHLENVDNTKDTVVTVSLTNGKAVIGEDYKGDTYTVTIPKGKTTATFEVPIVNDDPAVYEGPEDYNVTITAINGQAVKTPADNQRVTTTIHDDGKGTPDGRDPNNPDNQDPNKPQDPTKPFDPSKPVDANNPDPRTPPKDKLPDADNDKPVVSITGTTDTNENGKTADGKDVPTYTIAIDNGKGATAPIAVKFKVDTGNDTTYDPLTAEANDIDIANIKAFSVDSNGDRTLVALTKEGDSFKADIPGSKLEVEVPLVNDNVYEGAETYKVVLEEAKIGDVDVKTTDVNKQTVTTTIYDNGTTDGSTPVTPSPTDPTKPDLNDPEKAYDKPQIELDPPAHVSEEGFPNGNKDKDSAKHADNRTVNKDTPENNDYDITDETKTSGRIRITNVDTTDPNLINRLSLDLSDGTKIRLSKDGPDLTWKGKSVADKITWRAYESNENDPALTVTINNDSRKVATVGGKQVVEFTYDVELHKPIYHAGGDVIKMDSKPGTGQDNLLINFNIIAKDGKAQIATENTVVVVVEDDAPMADAVVHNIEVGHNAIALSGLNAGFTDSVIHVSGVDRYYPTTARIIGKGVKLSGHYGNVSSANYGRPEQYNTDKDELGDLLQWGTPAKTKSAGYSLTDTDLSALNLQELTTPFTLGRFNHSNYGVYGSGGILVSTKIAVEFDVNVNGATNRTPRVEFNVTHLETTNLNAEEVTNHVPSNDFVIIKDSNQLVRVGGTVYKLQIDGFEKVGSSESADKLTIQAFSNLTQHAWMAKSNTPGFLSASAKTQVINKNIINGREGQITVEALLKAVTGSEGEEAAEKASNLGLTIDTIDTIVKLMNNVKTADSSNLTDQVDNVNKLFTTVSNIKATSVEQEALKSKLIQYVLQGNIMTTKENTDNNYDIKAHLEPISTALNLETNVNVQGKIHVGGDSNGTPDVDWIAAVDKDSGILEVTKEGGTTTIKTIYGTFTGKANGGYNFKGVSDLDKIVKESDNVSFKFNYRFQDTDGDIAESSVEFNFTGLTTGKDGEMSTPKDKMGKGDENDYFIGSTGAETLNGGNGDDALKGNGGGDTLIGGKGNDVIFYDKDAFIYGDLYDAESGKAVVDTEANFDTLSLANWVEFDVNNAPKDIDLNAKNIHHMEAIDMTNDFAQTLNISASDVLSMTDDRNAMYITGDTEGVKDTVSLSDFSRKQGTDATVTKDDVTYDVYTGSGATLYIEQGLNVSGV
ncbi:hypothetical protein LP122_02025 [Moraxella bovis]|uniref:Calx-beta domain-containing protein n=1 Tax=Moraxella bovis TaxID=476 RepID=UPI00222664F8|nr:Calx-beta domain-containing protein [Moraxella bovis]UYZ68904.1 hypothetical protein LP122_02025 [Moraxella bovis]